MARVLYILVSIVLFPLFLANLGMCQWAIARAMDLADDSSLLHEIVAFVIAIFFVLSAAATRRVLRGESPVLMRVLWLPGLIGDIAAAYLFFISIELRADKFSLALFSPDALARLSGRDLLVVVAGTVVVVASVIVVDWHDQWRQAIARAKAARSGRPSS